MECPHCNQDLSGGACPACEQKVLAGADFCHACGHQLAAPEGEEPKQIVCASCEAKALPGAEFCHACGHQLAAPEGEEPAQLVCAACGRRMAATDHYCASCGEPLGEEEPGEAPAAGERVACSDGSCIGIIGEDGKCTECGKPYSGPAL